MEKQNKDRMFSFRIPLDIFNDLDDYAKSAHISKGSVICLALSELFAKKKVINSLTDISSAITLLTNGKELDEDTEKKLDDFQRVCSIALGKN